MLPDRVLSSRTAFEGSILRLTLDEIETADGHRSTREVVRTAGAVAIVCVHQGDLWFVRQYRHAAGEALLEIPAGKIDAGETPEACAERELVEEIGLRPSSLTPLGTFFASPGFTDHRLTMYLAESFDAQTADSDPGEVIEVERRRADSVGDLLRSGEIKDSKTMLGLALYALRS